jgi:uncharacterized protein (TIGR00255 family)
MKSMTGYAYAERTVDENVVSIEIRGYNNRFLETAVILPPSMNVVEKRIRGAVSECCTRGKVEVSVRLRKPGGSRPPAINKNALISYVSLFNALSEVMDSEEKIMIRDLIRAEGILETDGGIYTEDSAWELIRDPLFSALALFDTERKREGEHTEKNIFSYLTKLEESEKKIKELAPQEEIQLKKTLQGRFAEITRGLIIDDSRLLSETALLVIKYSILEELARLEAHISEFRKTMKSGGSMGKKLDFLCQEINREVNTIGAKSQSLAVVREVVELKENIEDIREQLRNVE